MNKEQIKEAILGQQDCEKEETPLCQFATFHPDMEMVELLLKGADIDKSFNHHPLAWVYQFCEPNWNEMLRLLFKYKYHALKFTKNELEYLSRMWDKLKPETTSYILQRMERHGFNLPDYINKSKRRLDGT